MPKKQKVLLIGVGRWGQNHLRVLQMLNTDLYVAEKSKEARKLCVENGIPEDHVFDDWKTLLPLVDAVDVVTPLDSHVEICTAALNAGKAVFVEKPMAGTVAEAEQLTALTRKTKGVLQVGHIFRYDSGSLYMRDFIRSGKLGKVRWIYGEFSGFKRPRNDAGVGWSDGLHFVDLANFLLGTEPEYVYCRTIDFLNRAKDDMCFIHLDYKDGVFCEIKANYFYPIKKREYVVVGEKATLFCDFTSSQDKIRVYTNSHILDGGTWKAVQGDVVHQEVPLAEPLYDELKIFLDAAAAGTPSPVGPEVGTAIAKVMVSAYESARTGKKTAV